MAGKPHVLIVEDNLDHQEFFSDTLSPQYELSFFAAPEACLSVLDRQPADLVIIDYYLQERYSGIELCRSITARFPSLPVIIVTAYGDETTAVEAIKSGAREYIKKTLDGDYVNRVAENIRSLLEDGASSPAADSSGGLLGFFMHHKKEFRENWRECVGALQRKTDPALTLTVADGDFETLFNAFLADLEDDEASRSLDCLKKMISAPAFRSGSLLTAELLNMSLKETARELIFRRYTGPTDGRLRLMRRVGSLIDRNDLELCKEYERIIEETTGNVMHMERVSTKLLLMRTLQHEIRQPLTYIFNSVELLLTGEYRDDTEKILSTILDQVKKIENLLFELEKDAEPPVKDYSDKLPIFDLSSEGGG
jgi:DNA-binding response OmpR family regulator